MFSLHSVDYFCDPCMSFGILYVLSFLMLIFNSDEYYGLINIDRMENYRNTDLVVFNEAQANKFRDVVLLNFQLRIDQDIDVKTDFLDEFFVQLPQLFNDFLIEHIDIPTSQMFYIALEKFIEGAKTLDEFVENLVEQGITDHTGDDDRHEDFLKFLYKAYIRLLLKKTRKD